ncbi:ABC transporter substrate-binding protein [Alicyclobacillus kakegawensis]|uniref:ABC transporter substrate-binding protein n=1 Tax=Alicyclobacillus kakegawensis TaxID=392012 RepID=UPI00082D63CC|nr:ABC transporter substrate-binding protein [Alicyclobacillus kakegawensis]
MSTLKKTAVLLLSIPTLAAALTGCGATSQPISTHSTSTGNHPTEGGAIEIDSTAAPHQLDPAKAFDGVSEEVVLELYDQLVTYKGSTSTIVPSVAERWTVSPDGKTYTFYLRKGIRFWNGDKLTAQSFIDEFERVLNPKVNSPVEGFIDPIVVGSSAYHKGKAKTVKGLEAPDPYTLVIHLTQPEPFFLQILAMPTFSAVDSKYIQSVGENAFDSTSPMGTGPFKLRQISSNQVVLTKNRNYWKKDQYGNRLPYLDKVTINVNPNAQLDAINFQNGTTALMGQLTDGIPSSSYASFMSNPKLRKDIVRTVRNATFYLGLNTHMAPLNNVKVRQAIEYAINKKKIVQLIGGRGLIANQPLPPGIQGYLQHLPSEVNYTYDPPKAKQLLKEAGYPKGVTITLYTYEDPDMVKILQSIQYDLSRVGIRSKVKSLALGAYMDLNTNGKTQAFLTDWGQDYPDPSDFLNSLFNTNQQPQNNSTLYSNASVDQWLNKAQTDTNTSERMELYKKVTIQVMKDAPIVPLYYSVRTDAVQPWVHGYYVSPSLRDPLQYLWVDSKHK